MGRFPPRPGPPRRASFIAQRVRAPLATTVMQTHKYARGPRLSRLVLTHISSPSLAPSLPRWSTDRASANADDLSAGLVRRRPCEPGSRLLGRLHAGTRGPSNAPPTGSDWPQKLAHALAVRGASTLDQVKFGIPTPGGMKVAASPARPDRSTSLLPEPVELLHVTSRLLPSMNPRRCRRDNPCPPYGKIHIRRSAGAGGLWHTTPNDATGRVEHFARTAQPTCRSRGSFCVDFAWLDDSMRPVSTWSGAG